MADTTSADPIHEANITGLGVTGNNRAAGPFDHGSQTVRATGLWDRRPLTAQDCTVGHEIGAPFLAITKLRAVPSLLGQCNSDHIRSTIAGKRVIFQETTRPGLGLGQVEVDRPGLQVRGHPLR